MTLNQIFEKASFYRENNIHYIVTITMNEKIH